MLPPVSTSSNSQFEYIWRNVWVKYELFFFSSLWLCRLKHLCGFWSATGATPWKLFILFSCQAHPVCQLVLQQRKTIRGAMHRGRWLDFLSQMECRVLKVPSMQPVTHFSLQLLVSAVSWTCLCLDCLFFSGGFENCNSSNYFFFSVIQTEQEDSHELKM